MAYHKQAMSCLNQASDLVNRHLTPPNEEATVYLQKAIIYALLDIADAIRDAHGK